ncbi:uncharacterized protein PGTG_21430 [Puccinia graminis f. sp. tritici CRL 75-36-700-3]|uniref:MULE transposase domain-containing protein n=1 Tax=Puccinia graminis f. sp. tritici (strain CRL 75-36-700-3 / race SCCL) TaxID=418459 RepID=H6QRA9_PUCGT|nr:uncharacterized protein PGTG_21430 [Puccinia graminis f. sp. tritici CRL 75-36-700-3]EHS63100.1 hypothetical protein PGTG_21430 [Puccinia graminis f. sp. tritici CRL 75-36-700-3]
MGLYRLEHHTAGATGVVAHGTGVVHTGEAVAAQEMGVVALRTYFIAKLRTGVVAAAPASGLTLAPGVVVQNTGVVAEKKAVLVKTTGVIESWTTVVNPPDRAELDPSLLAPVGVIIPGTNSKNKLFSRTPATIATPAVKPKETIRPVTGPPERLPPPCQTQGNGNKLLASQANNNTGNNAEEDKPESDLEEKTTTTKKNPTIPPTPAREPHTDIPTPPAATYSKPLILEHSIKTFAWENGFVIVRKRTVPGKSITFKCDRAQIQMKAGEEWNFTELYEQMKKLGDAGLKPAQILQLLKKTHPNQSILATIFTVYSARKKARAEDLRGLSPIVHLNRTLTTDFTSATMVNNSGKILGLFFCHNHSIHLLCHFNYALFLNCTYKTNKYCMPLLHIAGVTGSNKSFSVAFAFLHKETKEYYEWALQSLLNVFTIKDQGSLK